MSRQKTAPRDLTEQNSPNLGGLQAVFPAYNLMVKRWGFLILGVGLIISSVGLTVVLASQTWDRINNHGRAVILSAFPLPTALYVLMFLIGVLLISLAIIFWHEGISLFEQGLVLRSARKSKIWTYENTTRFDSHLTQVTFAGSMVSTDVKLILEDQTGQRMVIRNRYKNLPILVDTLRNTIVPLLIKNARQRLQRGEDLVFHQDLQANPSAILILGEEMPYQSVEVAIENQVLKLHQAGDIKQVYFKSRVHDIRNLDVLFNLLEDPPKGAAQPSSR
ncbi:MAG: DUF6585 family protein [Brevefilum sp.]